MEKLNEFEEKICNYFSNNKEVPQKIKESILNTDLKRRKKLFNFERIRNIIVAENSLATN